MCMLDGRLSVRVPDLPDVCWCQMSPDQLDPAHRGSDQLDPTQSGWTQRGSPTLASTGCYLRPVLPPANLVPLPTSRAQGHGCPHQRQDPTCTVLLLRRCKRQGGSLGFLGRSQHLDPLSPGAGDGQGPEGARWRNKQLRTRMHEGAAGERSIRKWSQCGLSFRRREPGVISMIHNVFVVREWGSSNFFASCRT